MRCRSPPRCPALPFPVPTHRADLTCSPRAGDVRRQYLPRVHRRFVSAADVASAETRLRTAADAAEPVRVASNLHPRARARLGRTPARCVAWASPTATPRPSRAAPVLAPRPPLTVLASHLLRQAPGQVARRRKAPRGAARLLPQRPIFVPRERRAMAAAARES